MCISVFICLYFVHEKNALVIDIDYDTQVTTRPPAVFPGFSILLPAIRNGSDDVRRRWTGSWMAGRLMISYGKWS